MHDVGSAKARFDRMLAMAAAVPDAKRPVIERSTGTIVGYTGVDTIAFEGVDRLEWGWRFTAEARDAGAGGRGVGGDQVPVSSANCRW